MSQIEEWQNTIRGLDAAIEPLVEQRAELRQKIREAKSPFKVGDEITWNGGRRRGRVVAIREWCGDPAWRVQRILKDGTIGEEQDVNPYVEPKLL